MTHEHSLLWGILSIILLIALLLLPQKAWSEQPPGSNHEAVLISMEKSQTMKQYS